MVGMLKTLLLRNVFSMYTPREVCTLAPPAQTIQRLKYLAALPKNSISLNQRLDQTRFVVFDTETTGLHPYAGDEIISLSAVIIENGKVDSVHYFDRYVNPCRPIPPLATEITGITEAQVQGQPDIFHVLEDFLDFAGNAVLVAHNADFDLGFINIKLKRFCETRLSHLSLDTLTLSFALHPGLKNHTLDNLAQIYDIPANDRHTSLGDSIITAQIFRHFMAQLEERRVHTLRDLYHYLHFRACL